MNSVETTGHARVFVVDDNEDVLSVLKLSLEMLGYEVSGFTRGQDAIDQFKTEQPDVVIVDHGLPDVMGIEVGRQIREWESEQRCALVLLTGNDGQTLRSQARKAGFDDFLVKPVRVNELAACVAR